MRICGAHARTDGPHDLCSVVGRLSRYVLALDPRFSYRAENVVQTLQQICATTGYRKAIRVDQGSEVIPSLESGAEALIARRFPQLTVRLQPMADGLLTERVADHGLGYWRQQRPLRAHLSLERVKRYRQGWRQ